MTMTETPPLTPVGQEFISNACTRCGHCASGMVTAHFGEITKSEVVAWGDAPDDCACECHVGWRVVHHLPLVLTTPTEGA